MKFKLLTLLLLAGGSVFAGPRLAVDVGIGGYPAPPPVVAYALPPNPGPGYSLCGRPLVSVRTPLCMARGLLGAASRMPALAEVAPSYYGRRYYRGYWRR